MLTNLKSYVSICIRKFNSTNILINWNFTKKLRTHHVEFMLNDIDSLHTSRAEARNEPIGIQQNNYTQTCMSARKRFHHLTSTREYWRRPLPVYVESGNLPAFASPQGASCFWQMVDAYDQNPSYSISTARLYRELHLSFPIGLTRNQQIKCMQTFLFQLLGTRHTYTVALFPETDTDPKPYCRCMFAAWVINKECCDLNSGAFFSGPKLRAFKDKTWHHLNKRTAIYLLWETTSSNAVEEARIARIDEQRLRIYLAPKRLYFVGMMARTRPHNKLPRSFYRAPSEATAEEPAVTLLA
jgi:hypothetical protein